MHNPKIGISLLFILLFLSTITASIPNITLNANSLKQTEEYGAIWDENIDSVKQDFSYGYDIVNHPYQEKQEIKNFQKYQTQPEIYDSMNDYYKSDVYSTVRPYPMNPSYDSTYTQSSEYSPNYSVKYPNLIECSNGLLVYDQKNCSYPEFIECPNGLLVYDLKNCRDPPVFDITFCEEPFNFYRVFVNEEESRNIINNFKQALWIELKPGYPVPSLEYDIFTICSAISILLEDPQDDKSQLLELSNTIQSLPTSGPNEDRIITAIINSLNENNGLPDPPPPPGTIGLEIGKGVECELAKDPTANQQQCDAILGTGSTDLEGTVTSGEFGPTHYDMILTNDNTPPDVLY